MLGRLHSPIRLDMVDAFFFYTAHCQNDEIRRFSSKNISLNKPFDADRVLLASQNISDLIENSIMFLSKTLFLSISVDVLFLGRRRRFMQHFSTCFRRCVRF
jgi:hypothetical protein